MNKNTSDRFLTIYHELSHYFQLISNIRITKQFSKKLNNFYKEKLNKFGITEEQIKYYFSSMQFNVHIDDLIVGLFNTYQNYYSNEHYYHFLDKVQQLCEQSNTKTIKELQYDDLWLNYNSCNNGNIGPLLMLIGSYLMHYKYQKIIFLLRTKWKKIK